MHMEQLSGVYEFNQDPTTVFEYMRKPENASDVAPSLVNSEGVRQLDSGAWIVRAEYELAGGIADGELILNPTKYTEYEEIEYEVDDDISGYINWKFEEHNNGTRFYYEAEYEVDIPVPKIFMSTVGNRLVENELDGMMENLQKQIDKAE